MAFTNQHLYFDDMTVGQEWISGGRTVTEADIVNYAGISGDFNPIHMDREFAKTTPYRRTIAHGFGVFTIASGLGVITPLVRTLGARRSPKLEISPASVFAGDTITMITRVVKMELKGRGKRGVINWYRGIKNQDGKTVQEGEVLTLVACRPLTKVD